MPSQRITPLLAAALFLSFGIPGNAQAAPIHDAAKAGDLAKVKQLLDADPTLANAKGVLSYTPLHFAAGIEKKDVAELLVLKGADVNAAAEGGETPLDFAVMAGAKETLDFLISKGARVTDIFQAAAAGDVEKVKAFLKAQPAMANAPDRSSIRPLCYAAMFGRKDVAEILLASGADAIAKDSQQGTPLHYAETGEIVEMLVAKGANVNAETEFGRTPLHHVAIRGCESAAARLIAKGARIDAKDSLENTPLLLATRYNRNEVAKLLISKGADVNAAGHFLNTPLHWAAREGNKELIPLLINKGASLKAKNVTGDTPFKVAKDKETLEILQKAAAKH